jgi:two-component system nitrogen regulation response regulator NtrX
MTPEATIDVGHLPEQFSAAEQEKRVLVSLSGRLADARARFEREFLVEKLRANHWNISRTAELVGLARESLSRKLRSLGVDVEKQRNGD